MLIAIDVGNTETKLGCFASDGSELLQSWRVTTDAKRTADEYGVFFSQIFATAELRAADAEAVVIASVVPKLDQTLAAACERYFDCEPVFFRPAAQQLLKIKTKHPEEVGADLVAAAIGAVELYGAPLIVISYGTATVFMAISAEREYLGVAIAPGISVSLDALVGRTAKLPQISLTAPSAAIGRDTVSALQSGLVFGFVGQTEALVERFRKEMGVQARVVATGGMVEAVARHTSIISDVHPHLSLLGLQRFYLSSR
ncbi:MAG TPA: type III pantothenate kinase [Candidatus Baltobacteraceae bacterium]|jgi:type III pantothenate kinase|nr:type III pantothenate kinase [Candidatus Baltobacteraceae bacterium]